MVIDSVLLLAEVVVRRAPIITSHIQWTASTKRWHEKSNETIPLFAALRPLLSLVLDHLAFRGVHFETRVCQCYSGPDAIAG